MKRFRTKLIVCLTLQLQLTPIHSTSFVFHKFPQFLKITFLSAKSEVHLLFLTSTVSPCAFKSASTNIWIEKDYKRTIFTILLKLRMLSECPYTNVKSNHKYVTMLLLRCFICFALSKEKRLKSIGRSVTITHSKCNL